MGTDRVCNSYKNSKVCSCNKDKSNHRKHAVFQWVCNTYKGSRLRLCIEDIRDHLKYAVFQLTISFLLIFLLLSVIKTFGYLISPVALLARWFPSVYLKLHSLINVEAVIKVGDVVGVCSLIVTWLYTTLGKEELGFRYSVLLQEICPRYHRFLLIQIVALFVSIWAASIGTLETGLWAILIVSVGNLVQWSALTDLVLLPSHRSRAAIKCWERIIEKNSEDKLKVTICDMAQYLQYNIRDCYQDIEKTLAHAIDLYIERDENKSEEVNWNYILRELAEIWAHLLNGRQESEQIFVSTGILRACAPESQFPMCASYFLWYHNAYMSMADSTEAQNNAINGMIEKKDILDQRFAGIEAQKSIVQCANRIVCSITWIYFILGYTSISSAWNNQTDETLRPKEQKILEELQRLFFPKGNVDRYWHKTNQSSKGRDH